MAESGNRKPVSLTYYARTPYSPYLTPAPITSTFGGWFRVPYGGSLTDNLTDSQIANLSVSLSLHVQLTGKRPNCP